MGKKEAIECWSLTRPIIATVFEIFSIFLALNLKYIIAILPTFSKVCFQFLDHIDV